MAVPTCKAELLAAIGTSFGKLLRDLERVPLSRVRETTLPGHVAGDSMSPADLVSYLIGWNSLVLKWLEQDDRGAAVDFPETGFKWTQLGPLAQKFYADYQGLDWADLIALLVSVNARLVDTVSARPEPELYGQTWYGKWTKGRMIQFNSSSPYANARGRLRKWLRARAPAT